VFLRKSWKENFMYRYLTALFACLCLSIPAAAQTNNEHRGYGYVYAGPLGSEDGAGITAGGGGDGLIYRGLSLGGDFAVLSPGSRWGRSFGAASFNGGYHFINASASGKVVPFVTAGPMAFFGDGVGYGFNAGGGVNYWFKERLGARFELRGHIPVNTDLQPLYSFRVGLSFR
jgi:hypothetical protein